MTMASPKPPAKFPVALTLITAVALAILVSLGVWQVKRLHWKEGLLAQIHALQSARPVPIRDALARVGAEQNVDYTRVQADCPDIETTPFLRLWAVPDERSGYRIITACALTDAPFGAILVDRGFITSDDAAKWDPKAGVVLTQPIVGVLRAGDRANFVTPKNQPAQNLWYFRDVLAMEKALHVTDAPPVFLMLESPAPKGLGPTPAALPLDIPNNHLSYAVTWFGLAASLLGVYVASLWRRYQG
jgi:surfeit locus 1 family protein